MAEEVEIDDEQDGSGNPGERIAEHHHFNGSVERYGGHNPHNSQDAYAQTGDQHGQPAVPNPSQCAGIDFDGHISDKGRNLALIHI